MEKSTKDQLQKSPLTTSKDMGNVTFSRALEDGHSHSDWLVCPMTGQCGREAVLANHSVLPGKVEELTMSATFGQLSGGLLHSENLQLSLESRLHHQMDVNGSLEYVLTWKQWDMRAGPPICALRASTRRTSGNVSGGWPTPVVDDSKNVNPAESRVFSSLVATSKMAGWPTPTDSMMTEQDLAQAMTAGNGKERKPYKESKIIAGWPTLTATDAIKGGKVTPRSGMMGLSETVPLSGWGTPCAHEPRLGYQNRNNGKKGTQKSLTTEVIDYIGTENLPSGLVEMATCEEYRLNHRFSLWLMGYPEEWGSCGERAMQSFRKKPRDSSSNH